MKNKNGETIVVKSNTLVEMRPYDMELNEQRFFLMYVGMIHPRDIQNTREVKFNLKEFGKLVGLRRTQPGDLKPVVEKLFKRHIEITLPNGWEWIHLFKQARVIEENGVWFVEMNCSDEMLPFISELRSNYTTYELSYALSLKSENQIRMYEILKSYQWKGEKILELEELRLGLGILEHQYPRFSDFNRRILKSCQDALYENTDIKFEYELIKTGRNITAIKFLIFENIPKPKTIADEIFPNEEVITTAESTIENGVQLPPSEAVPNDNQEELAENNTKQKRRPTPEEFNAMSEEELHEWYGPPIISNFAVACNFEFDEDEIQVLLGIFREEAMWLLNAKDQYGYSKAYYVLGTVYQTLQLRRKKEKITHPHGWMKVALRARCKDESGEKNG